jgi:hypothetical protein
MQTYQNKSFYTETNASAEDCNEEKTKLWNVKKGKGYSWRANSDPTGERRYSPSLS